MIVSKNQLAILVSLTSAIAAAMRKIAAPCLCRAESPSSNGQALVSRGVPSSRNHARLRRAPRLAACLERRRDAGDEGIGADRLSQYGGAALIDEALGHVAGIAGDVEDAGAALLAECGIADIDAMRIEA